MFGVRGGLNLLTCLHIVFRSDSFALLAVARISAVVRIILSVSELMCLQKIKIQSCQRIRVQRGVSRIQINSSQFGPIRDFVGKKVKRLKILLTLSYIIYCKTKYLF